MSDQNTVRYHGCDTRVCLGDRVLIRGLFRKRYGRINYVPSVSKSNEEMEFNGLTYAGIELDDGGLVGTVVAPDTHFLKQSIIFLRRDSETIQEIRPGDQFEG